MTLKDTHEDIHACRMFHFPFSLVVLHQSSLQIYTLAQTHSVDLESSKVLLQRAAKVFRTFVLPLEDMHFVLAAAAPALCLQLVGLTTSFFFLTVVRGEAI